jgi:hypothetical protein
MPITITARELWIVQYASLEVLAIVIAAFRLDHEARPLAGWAYHIAVISRLAPMGLKFITPTFGAR